MQVKEEIILDYEDFIIVKRDDKYYVRDSNKSSEYFEVELLETLTDERIQEESMCEADLIAWRTDYDYAGEYLYGTDYMYFKLKNKEKEVK